MNWFKNNISLDSSIQNTIQKDIDNHITDVKNLILSLNIPVNIYLAGSLFRGEPALYKKNNCYYLFSDLDFILIVKSGFDNQLPQLETLTLKLNNLYPEYKDSIIFITESSVNKFKSCIGKDLQLSLSFPIHLGFQLTNNLNVKITKDDLFDCVVHQLTCYFLNTISIGHKKDFFGKNLAYSKLKLVLECLRVLLYKSGYETKGYFDVYDNRKNYSFINDYDVSSLIRKREIFNEQEPITIDLYTVLTQTLIQLFVLKTKQNEIVTILEFINNRAKEMNDFLHQYQCLVYLYALTMTVSSESDKVIIFNSLVQLLSELSYDIKSKDYNSSILEIQQLLILLRKRYLIELNLKDTGENGFSDINN